MKYKCDMVRDLMPLCVDDAATQVSKNVVVEHLAECKECEKYYSKVMNEISIESNITEESKGYVAIAKKIRKKIIIRRTIIFFIVFIAFELLLNFALGYRYSPISAAKLSGRLNFSAQVIGKYDWGDYKFYVYESDNSYDVVTVIRYWNGWKVQDNSLVWPKYMLDRGGIINAGSMYYWTDTSDKFGIQLFPIIVEDANVTNIKISIFNETKTIAVEPNKLTILTFENQNSQLGNHQTGYAYDADGNLLYTLEESKETMRYLWQKINN